ncbi:MAG TPA: GtrA family protein [Salinarimonas sp.]|nr:GtrA family protein [Salinarimonas sp.]
MRAGLLATPLPRFLVVGALSTLTYAMLAHLALAGLGWRADVASLAAYALAAAGSYAAHRTVTFRSRRPHRAAGWRFALVSVAGYGLAFAIPWLLTERLRWAPIAATGLVCVAIPMLNALALSRFVFEVRLLRRAAPSPEPRHGL